jgi:hypothetical protein
MVYLKEDWRTPTANRANWIFGILGAVVLIGVGILYGLGRKHVDVTEAPQLTVGGTALGEPVERLLLYFGDPAHVGLVREPRVIASGTNLEERIGNCIRELASGSLRENLPVVPPDTQLRRAYLDSWGVAYLDFTRDLLGRRTPGDGEEWLAVAAIVRSVCDNFPEVREVRFLVEGQLVVSLAGYMDLEEPLRSEDFPLSGEQPS